jgi:hypothetical protein
MTKPNPTKEDLDALRFDLVGFIRTQIVAATPRLRLAEHLADNDLLGSAPPPEHPRERSLWVMSSSRPPPRDDPGVMTKFSPVSALS